MNVDRSAPIPTKYGLILPSIDERVRQFWSRWRREGNNSLYGARCIIIDGDGVARPPWRQKADRPAWPIIDGGVP